jgi:hypothetical protein
MSNRILFFAEDRNWFWQRALVLVLVLSRVATVLVNVILMTDGVAEPVATYDADID